MTREQADRFTLERSERTAFSIVFSEFEGNRFDWRAMKFVERA